jgi:hypothetical protein
VPSIAAAVDAISTANVRGALMVFAAARRSTIDFAAQTGGETMAPVLIDATRRSMPRQWHAARVTH